MQKTKRPYLGPQTKTAKPIIEVQKLREIRENLANSPRDYALFVLGVETAYRAGDLLNLKIKDVRKLRVGDRFMVQEGKTNKRRAVTINEGMALALKAVLKTREDADPNDYLFVGHKRKTKLDVCTLGRLVKKWCADVGLTEAGYSAHSLRKTFGYHNRVNGDVPIEVLQEIYGHSSARVTLTYIAIQPDEIRNVYMRGVM